MTDEDLIQRARRAVERLIASAEKCDQKWTADAREPEALRIQLARYRSAAPYFGTRQLAQHAYRCRPARMLPLWRADLNLLEGYCCGTATCESAGVSAFALERARLYAR